MIEVRELRKRYGELEALKGIDFDVHRGEVVGLLGPNGAGKSTAMRILTGYLAPTSGSAKVMGEEVIADPVAAQRHIGYLPEGNPLYLELRLIEAMRFAAGLHGLKGGDRDRAIGEALDAAGLVGLERRRIATFSRGYRQRVGLAKALLHKPPVLILDEPSSGLDPNQQRDMRQFIRGLGERCAVVFSTHILPEVAATCDRAVVIAGGSVVAAGTVAEVEAAAGLEAEVEARVAAGDPEVARAAWAALDGVDDVRIEADRSPPRVVARLAGAADPERLGALARALQDAGVLAWGVAPASRSLDDVFARLTAPVAKEVQA
ncbi:MAG: ABC transporter ATP-binding protein [Planctomycetes bacterium]|nr:ABC transporter ATP-binding protein [Planctomycetota bacterium]MCB9899851.1 ABC transporter ATP-binding protein [Planctomycetota bacterium]